MFTYYLANRVLNTISGKGSLNIGNTYVGLSKTAPARDGSNVTEPDGNGYGRALLGAPSQSASYKMDEPSNGRTENRDIIYFPEAKGQWGTCTHFCIFDAPVDGNLLVYGELDSAISPTGDTVPMARIGNVVFTLE